MNKRDEAKLAKLSMRAQKLFRRLQDGAYYPCDAERTPAAMKELTDAGLVDIMGRPVVWRVCYVPKGSRPARLEQIAGG